MLPLRFLPALFALAAATPLPAPQDLDFTLLNALSHVVPCNPNPSTVLRAALSHITTSASTTIELPQPNLKRTACEPQPSGATGAPSVADSPAAFTANAAFASMASAAPIPSGYAQMYENLDASNNANGYMGYTTLQSYDVEACAADCTGMYGCLSFNIYFERDPSLEPGTNCPDPPSVTMIRCAFWGGPIDSSNAVNTGQYRESFEVVIAGSNGYQNQSSITATCLAGSTFIVQASGTGNSAVDGSFLLVDSYSNQGYMADLTASMSGATRFSLDSAGHLVDSQLETLYFDSPYDVSGNSSAFSTCAITTSGELSCSGGGSGVFLYCDYLVAVFGTGVVIAEGPQPKCVSLRLQTTEVC